jgi:hypothetical protein
MNFGMPNADKDSRMVKLLACKLVSDEGRRTSIKTTIESPSRRRSIPAGVVAPGGTYREVWAFLAPYHPGASMSIIGPNYPFMGPKSWLVDPYSPPGKTVDRDSHTRREAAVRNNKRKSVHASNATVIVHIITSLISDKICTLPFIPDSPSI